MISFHRVDALRESSPNDRRTRLDRIPRSHSSSPSRASIPSHLDFRLARVRIARPVRARRPIRARRIRIRARPPSPSSIERDDRPNDRPNASRSRLASSREDESTSPERARTIRARSIDASRRRARAGAMGRHLSGSLCVCVFFFFARVVIVFYLIDGVVFVYVEWRARAGPSRRCARGRDGTARPRDDLNGMEWDEMRCDCRVRARTGVSDGRDANGGIETRSNDRSTTRERERERGTRRRDRTRVSFAPPRIVIVDSWCEITIRATVEDGRGG